MANGEGSYWQKVIFNDKVGGGMEHLNLHDVIYEEPQTRHNCNLTIRALLAPITNYFVSQFLVKTVRLECCRPPAWASRKHSIGCWSFTILKEHKHATCAESCSLRLERKPSVEKEENFRIQIFFKVFVSKIST